MSSFDLDKINKALQLGVKSISHGDNADTTTFMSADELLKLQKELNKLNKSASGKARQKVGFFSHRTGL